MHGPKSRASTEEELAEFDNLFQAVMKNKWEEVVTAYKNSPKAREARLIRKSEDTALHIAVSNGQTNHALNMVDTIDKDLLKRIRNAKGNTPLHLAAVHGDMKICEKMVSTNPDLMGVRNKDGETPIFLAARHGQSKIFFYLHEEFRINDEYLRRDDGDTILHVAISGEFYSKYSLFHEEFLASLFGFNS